MGKAPDLIPALDAADFDDFFGDHNGGLFAVRDSRIEHCGPDFCALLGLPVEKILGHTFTEFVAPDDREQVRTHYKNRMSGKSPYAMYYTRMLCHSDTQATPEIIWCRIIARRYVAANGDVCSVGNMENAHDEVERQMRRSKYAATIESAPLRIVITGPDGRIENLNTAFARHYGVTENAVLGQLLSDVSLPMQQGQYFHNILQSCRDHEHWYGDISYRERDGSEKCDHFVVQPILSPEKDELTGIAFYAEDVTKERQNRQITEGLAKYDLITRAHRVGYLNNLIDGRIEEGEHGVILVASIENLGNLRNLYGYAFKDETLTNVFHTLEDILEDRNTLIARADAGEFVIYVRLDADEPADMTAQVLSNRIKHRLELPVPVQETNCFCEIRIGISLCPEDGGNAMESVRAALFALHRARTDNVFSSRFSPDIEYEQTQRAALEHAVRSIVPARDLVLYYQPKIALATGRIIAAEALLRVRHADGTIGLPPDFIPLAEETGLIVPIGEWVIRSALAQQKIWQDSYPGLHSSLNISPVQLRNEALCQQFENFLLSSLDEAGIPAHSITLEITEGVLMNTPARNTVERLRRRGFGISIDDFGIGYSSLSYLRNFDASEVKIDRSFVINIEHSPRDRALVTSVVALGRAFDMRVVVEGIENRAQEKIIRDLGCEIGQGFLYARPGPAGNLGKGHPLFADAENPLSFQKEITP
ncbi:MAG: EAL domain-containing protein [Pseudomonadota bacterium]